MEVWSFLEMKFVCQVWIGVCIVKKSKGETCQNEFESKRSQRDEVGVDENGVTNASEQGQRPWYRRRSASSVLFLWKFSPSSLKNRCSMELKRTHLVSFSVGTHIYDQIMIYYFFTFPLLLKSISNYSFFLVFFLSGLGFSHFCSNFKLFSPLKSRFIEKFFEFRFGK